MSVFKTCDSTEPFSFLILICKEIKKKKLKTNESILTRMKKPVLTIINR